MSSKGILTGGRALTQWLQENATQGSLLQKIINAVNTLADNTASSAVGKLPPPPPPQSINVTTPGGFMQVTVNHSAEIQKGIQYLTHISTDPQFSQPLIVDHGSSRSPAPFSMPVFDHTGAPIPYYVRTLAQYQGSDPSEPTIFGGNAPTPITLNGATAFLQPGTGSGTGSTTGQQSLVGLGKQQRSSPGIPTGGAIPTSGGIPAPPTPPSGAAGGDLSGTYPNPIVVSTHLTAPLPIGQGGTGTAAPGLIAGTGVTITGSWPDQTIASTGAPPTGAAGGDLTGTYPNPTLVATAVTPGSYTNTNLTVDTKGRITAAANGSAGTGTVTHTTGALTSGQLVIGNGAADIKVGDLTGDVTTSGATATAIAANAVTTSKINNSAVTLAKIQNAAANSVLVGSGASGSGAPYSELSLGTGLSMSGTTLNASGSATVSLLVGSAFNNAITGSTSVAATITPLDGTCLVAIFGTAQHSATLVSGIASVPALTWTLMGSNIGGVLDPTVVAWVAPNPTGVSTTVTVTLSGASTSAVTLSLANYNASIALTLPGDGFNSQSHSGGSPSTTWTTNNLTTTASADLLVAWGWNASSIGISVAANYTTDATFASVTFSAAFGSLVVNAAGSYGTNIVYASGVSNILTAIIGLRLGKGGVTSVNTRTGDVTITGADLAAAGGVSSLTTSGGTGAATLAAGVLNIPNYSAGGLYLPTPFSFPPAIAAFTWINQGSATAASNGGPWTLTMPHPGGSNQWAVLYKANDFSTPYAIGIGHKAWLPGSSFMGAALVLTDGTKLLLFQMALTTGTTLAITIERWTNATTFSSTVFSQTTISGLSMAVNASPLEVCYLRWRNDASTLYADVSLDGYKWQNIYTEAVAAFLTPTGYGFGMRNDQTGKTPYATLLGWNPVNNATL